MAEFFDAWTGSQTLGQISGLLSSDPEARRWARMAKAPNSARDATLVVAICDGSVDFASDRYDASSAADYDAKLDANTYLEQFAHLRAFRRGRL